MQRYRKQEQGREERGQVGKKQEAGSKKTAGKPGHKAGYKHELIFSTNFLFSSPKPRSCKNS